MQIERKQFSAFGGECCYPSGGMNDHIGDFDHKDEAYATIVEKLKTLGNQAESPEDVNWSTYWGHIVDNGTGERVWDSPIT